ncbi:MAG: BlaI/MecI/CopY family transcriptional regulator [Thermoguttaceae bacterium]
MAQEKTKQQEKPVILESLAPRERQIVEAVYRLSEASVQEVLDNIPDPPSYSAVRAMLTILVQKGVLEFRREKTRYLYSPVLAKDAAQKSILRNLLNNFFCGKPADAVAALLDVAGDDLTETDYAELKALIDKKM